MALIVQKYGGTSGVAAYSIGAMGLGTTFEGSMVDCNSAAHATLARAGFNF